MTQEDFKTKIVDIIPSLRFSIDIAIDEGYLSENEYKRLNETEELFSNKIVSRYDLVDAWLDGVLPIPCYKYYAFHLMIIRKRQYPKKYSKPTLRSLRQVL